MCKADHFNVGKNQSIIQNCILLLTCLSCMHCRNIYQINERVQYIQGQLFSRKQWTAIYPQLRHTNLRHKNTDGLLPKIWVRVNTRCWDHQVSFRCLRIIKEPEKRINCVMMLYWNMGISAATEVNVKLGVVVNDITIIITIKNYWIVYGANAWSNSSALL